MAVAINATLVIDNTFDYIADITVTNEAVVPISPIHVIDNSFDYIATITVTNETPVPISSTLVIPNDFDYNYWLLSGRTSFNTRQTMNVQPGVGFQTLTFPDHIYKSYVFRWVFKMVAIADYATPLIISPASLAVAISTYGSAFTTVTATIYSVGNGWYYIDIPIDYMYSSVIALKASGAGLYTSDEVIYLYTRVARNAGNTMVITGDFDYNYLIEIA
jgi:hypothetical protein